MAVTYSVIVETVDAKSSRDAAFAISGGLSAGTLHVWRTNLKIGCHKGLVFAAGGYPADQRDVLDYASAGLRLQPDHHDRAGQRPDNAAAFRPLALPYREDFQKYALGTTPALVQRSARRV